MSQKNKNKTIKLIKLITENGDVLKRDGYFDLEEGIFDFEGNCYIAGFDEYGNIHAEMAINDPNSNEDGEVIFWDGRRTGYNVHKNYKSLVSLNIVL